jgi:hypothetical protein
MWKNFFRQSYRSLRFPYENVRQLHNVHEGLRPRISLRDRKMSVAAPIGNSLIRKWLEQHL